MKQKKKEKINTHSWPPLAATEIICDEDLNPGPDFFENSIRNNK